MSDEKAALWARKERGDDGRSEVSERSDNSSVRLAPPTWRQLRPLRSKDDVRQFLRGVLPRFVSHTDVLRSGFIDQLISLGVLTDRDNESIHAAQPVPSEQTRRVWDILFNIHHAVFVSKVLPVFCDDFYHVIPERFWLSGDAVWSENEAPRVDTAPRCCRCTLQRRVRPTDLADFLMTAGLLTSKQYGEVIRSYKTHSTDWTKLFNAFKTLAGRDVTSHVSKMGKLMREHSLVEPDNLQKLMKRGFPCSCPSSNKTGRCLPTLACLSVASIESNLPSVHSLPVTSVGEGEGSYQDRVGSLQTFSGLSDWGSMGSVSDWGSMGSASDWGSMGSVGDCGSLGSPSLNECDETGVKRVASAHLSVESLLPERFAPDVSLHNDSEGETKLKQAAAHFNSEDWASTSNSSVGSLEEKLSMTFSNEEHKTCVKNVHDEAIEEKVALTTVPAPACKRSHNKVTEPLPLIESGISLTIGSQGKQKMNDEENRNTHSFSTIGKEQRKTKEMEEHGGEHVQLFVQQQNEAMFSYNLPISDVNALPVPAKQQSSFIDIERISHISDHFQNPNSEPSIMDNTNKSVENLTAGSRIGGICGRLGVKSVRRMFRPHCRCWLYLPDWDTILHLFLIVVYVVFGFLVLTSWAWIVLSFFFYNSAFVIIGVIGFSILSICCIVNK